MAAIYRIGASLGVRAGGSDIQRRLDWYFGGKLPLSNLHHDRQAFGAILMASALPEDDFEPFLAATVLLLLERLTSDGGPDNAFWNWNRHASHYRLAPPETRAAIMCGFREARRHGRITLPDGPTPEDCLTAPRDAVLAALGTEGAHPVLTRLRAAVADDHDAGEIGVLWAAEHGALDALPVAMRRAAYMGFRHLYERPASIVLPAGAEAPAIPFDE